MKEKFSLTTKNGCLRTIALCLGLIVLFSFFAHLISTDFGSVKITRLSLDTRGANIDADLYYPRGTSSKDKLPAVVVAHGGGVAKGIMSGIAQELARRGFVVMNVSSYGSGLSEQPVVDDYGIDSKEFTTSSSFGLLDAIAYVRSLAFVDQTRVGIIGHSMGALRTGIATIDDCGYYTFNDIMINILCDAFGQTFTEEEIYIDADELAQERLNADQLAYYNELKANEKEIYDTRIKSGIYMGTSGTLTLELKTVQVAGHEVLRNVQTNFMVLLGTWDVWNVPGYEHRDRSTEYWVDTDDIVSNSWYLVDTEHQTGSVPGSLYDTSVLNNDALREGIKNRIARMVCRVEESHSKNFFSVQSSDRVVKFMEQTLAYNGGELGAAGASPIDSSSNVYILREFLNLGAMLSMAMLVISTVGALVQIPYFSSSITVKEHVSLPVTKKMYWLFAGFTTIVGFFAMYYTNNFMVPKLPSSKFIPQLSTWWLTFLFIAIMASYSLILLVVESKMDKKNYSMSRMSGLNIKMKFTGILKALLVCVIALTVAYGSLSVIEYLFNEDYRFWMAVFTEMRVEFWGWLWRYTIMMIPCYLLIGAAINYTIRDDIPLWKDNLITVIINSAGAFICFLVTCLMLISTDKMFSHFGSTYGFLLIIPLTVYITRKMYLITKSIWYGAIVNALLVSWSIISTVGINADHYLGQNWISCFLGK